ncbi:hypothetical protein AVEN_195003-1 [Araneus ventricosus]|uniref:Uncharacterized protein n=1 Tax=Araneus ventricosus TaxID=182803 RepID=A0A4Y2HPE6_ARAVE|nr:hypothetical protein AVEN_195003-1 [Araneus ventricosus]
MHLCRGELVSPVFRIHCVLLKTSPCFVCEHWTIPWLPSPYQFPVLENTPNTPFMACVDYSYSAVEGRQNFPFQSKTQEQVAFLFSTCNDLSPCKGLRNAWIVELFALASFELLPGIFRTVSAGIFELFAWHLGTVIASGWAFGLFLAWMLSGPILDICLFQHTLELSAWHLGTVLPGTLELFAWHL